MKEISYVRTSVSIFIVKKVIRKKNYHTYYALTVTYSLIHAVQKSQRENKSGRDNINTKIIKEKKTYICLELL